MQEDETKDEMIFGTKSNLLALLSDDTLSARLLQYLPKPRIDRFGSKAISVGISPLKKLSSVLKVLENIWKDCEKIVQKLLPPSSRNTA